MKKMFEGKRPATLVLSLVLMAALTVGGLTGCGNKEVKGNEAGNVKQSEQTQKEQSQVAKEEEEYNQHVKELTSITDVEKEKLIEANHQINLLLDEVNAHLGKTDAESKAKADEILEKVKEIENSVAEIKDKVKADHMKE